MFVPQAFGRLAFVVDLFAVAAAALASAGAARAQGPYAPITLDSFENPAGVSLWDAVTPQSTIYLRHEQSTVGATDGAHSLRLEMEGNDEYCELCLNIPGEFGWALHRNFTPSDVVPYNALAAALSDPHQWILDIDVTTNAASWVNAPPSTSPSLGTRVQIATGLITSGSVPPFTLLNTALDATNLYGTTQTRRLSFPMSNLAGSPAVPPDSPGFDLHIGAWNIFAPANSATGAVVYFDNLRLRPKYPAVQQVVWDFESDDSSFQGWSESGNTGISTSHKHHIVTGLGATNTTINGNVAPAPAGHALLIDTSNIPPGVNGFQWGSAMTLNADVDNDGAIDDPAAKAKMANLVALMKVSESIQFDITFHNSLSPPAGLPPAAVPGEQNAPWLRVALGVWTDGTPANGAGGGGLQQFQYDNDFATDLSGQTVEISRGDIAEALTGALEPSVLEIHEPLTMTFPLAAMGNLASAVQSGVFDDSNFLRLSLAVKTGTGDSTILAVIDNIRFALRPQLESDFDYDGEVDAHDMGVWRGAFGDPTGADANGDFDVDGSDFLVWQRQLGNALPPLPQSGAIPEPSAFALTVAAALIMSVRSGRAGNSSVHLPVTRRELC